MKKNQRKYFEFFIDPQEPRGDVGFLGDAAEASLRVLSISYVQASLQSHLGHYPWPERLPGQRVGLFPASGPLCTGYVQQRMSNTAYTGVMSNLCVCEVKERQTAHVLPQSSEEEDSLIDSVSDHWYSDMTDSRPPTRTPAATHSDSH